jgi:hypothetical protein
LNNLSDDELEKVKSKMDVNFKSRQLKPGDDGFEYDKRTEFKPTGLSEWDSDF